MSATPIGPVCGDQGGGFVTYYDRGSRWVKVLVEECDSVASFPDLALARNPLFAIVVLAHGVRRLAPPY